MKNEELKQAIRGAIENIRGDWKEDVKRKLEQLYPLVKHVIWTKKMYEEHMSIKNGARKQEAANELFTNMKDIIEHILLKYTNKVDANELSDIIAETVSSIDARAKEEIGKVRGGWSGN